MNKSTVIEFIRRVPVNPGSIARQRAFCMDGFSISIQVGRSHYCTPRVDDASYYTEFEIGYPSSPVPELIPYVDGEYSEKMDLTKEVYAYVPLEVIENIVKGHGGIWQVNYSLLKERMIDTLYKMILSQLPKYFNGSKKSGISTNIVFPEGKGSLSLDSGRYFTNVEGHSFSHVSIEGVIMKHVSAYVEKTISTGVVN